MDKELIRNKDCSSILRMLHIEMRKKFNQEMKNLGMTSPQVEVLMYLVHQKKKEEVNQKDIEYVTGLSNPTVSGILNRLEEKDFIKRETSKRDARYKIILLTEKATTMKECLCTSGRMADERLVEGITEEEKQIFKETAIKMMENLKKSRQEDSND